ncbi:MAG: hypothetical protein AB8B61_00725 [Cyclobacteriaceae bacterium]
MKQNNEWEVVCNHTPEIIDRIVMPIRKRGICVKNLNYTQVDDLGKCHIEFEAEKLDAVRIYKNMIRVTDILEVDTKN